MEKKVASPLFVNDGSFLERFKQLQENQQENTTAMGEHQSGRISTLTSKPNESVNKSALDFKPDDNKRKVNLGSSGGKLAFSLKPKSKLAAAPVKFDDDDDGGDGGMCPTDSSTKRQKLGSVENSSKSSELGDVAPAYPSDPTVKNVADKLASFVAKNGKQFENITRQRNPGDTPFKFLFDTSCADYKYYENKLIEEEKHLAKTKDTEASHSVNTVYSSSRTLDNSRRIPSQQHSMYQIPASSLYETIEDVRSSIALNQVPVVGRTSSSGQLIAPSASDPVAMMEFYAKKAAQEERRKQPKLSKDEMPPPASLQGSDSGKKGHHMGDYIPPEELEKFLASCNDAAARKAVMEAAERSKIQADNVGHKLLSKMGWKEGEGLGTSKSGRADPISAGNVKLNNLGVGAEHPAEVTPEDDIYEQYKKRMMLGYRHRPNPLNNPRKAYY